MLVYIMLILILYVILTAIGYLVVKEETLFITEVPFIKPIVEWVSRNEHNDEVMRYRITGLLIVLPIIGLYLIGVFIGEIAKLLIWKQ